MAQQFDYPKSETELRVTLDALYTAAKTAHEGGERPSFKGLIEIVSAQATIITAIHNIKSNKGSTILHRMECIIIKSQVHLKRIQPHEDILVQQITICLICGLILHAMFTQISQSFLLLKVKIKIIIQLDTAL